MNIACRAGSTTSRARSTWLLSLSSLYYALCMLSVGVWGFDEDRNDNLAVYWGQDSSGNQQNLSFYCQDDVYDAIPLAFLYVFFGIGGEPMIDFANICNTDQNGVFPDTQLANCSFMASDIQDCQSKGKIVTVSLGGADSSVGFTNESQAENFADQIWDQFLGGSSDVRPFGDAILDGVDLDIEGGLPDFYGNFVNQLRTHFAKADKKYYVTAAPQCPFPDANIGEALNSAPFDAVYVQFYNNYCGLDEPSDFDFSVWDDWARNQSPNPDVKVYIGAPGSATAAGQGYVDITMLQNYALDAQQNYSTFGGVMLWDASDAYENNRYDKAIKDAMSKTGADVPNSPPSTEPGAGNGSGSNNTTPPSTPPSSGGNGGGLPFIPATSNSSHSKTCFLSEDQVVWVDKARTTYSANVQLLPREGIKILFWNTRKVVDVVSSVIRYHLSSVSRYAEPSSLSEGNRRRQKLKLHKRSEI